MYTIDDRDTVVPLPGVPQCSPGAPLPVLVADEFSVVLAYLVHEPDPDWDGTYVHVVSPDSEGHPVAVVSFDTAYAHLFGPPNDEAFSGHPLASRGLEPYSASEVLGSPWIRRLERMNSVHPHHSPERFSTLRHLIFAFHDSTFECLTRSFNVSTHRGSLSSAFARMIPLLRSMR